MDARISRIMPDIDLPEYQSAEAAGFDIAAAEAVTFEVGAVGKVRTGLVIEAPVGYYLMITARSSLAQKKSLTLANGVGIIDRDYSGPNDELFIQVLNIGKVPVTIEKGERVAQGIFLPVRQVTWVETDRIRDTDRGGFGSTGGYVTQEAASS